MVGLTHQRKFSKKIVEIDEEFEIETIVENKKILPVTFLCIKEMFPSKLIHTTNENTDAENLHTTTMMILPYQRVIRKFKVSCHHRGRHLFNDVKLIGGDFLGFDTTTKTIEYFQEVVVLPKIVALEEQLIPYGDYCGDVSVKRWIIEDPVLTVGLREYTGYEPLKTIHWSSSLKQGNLMVRTFDYTTDNSVFIILNVECSKLLYHNVENDKIEKCITIARSVIDQLEDAKIPYQFITNATYCGDYTIDQGASSGLGPAHYSHLVEGLGRILGYMWSTFEDLLSNLIINNHKYATFVIITPTVLDDYIEHINSLNVSVLRTALISLENKNLEYLNDNILKYIERKE